MSIFTKPTTEKVPMRNNDSPPTETGLSVIAAGMKIVGDIESTGVVKIEGMVEGAIRGARQLLLGRQGTVHGDIRAHEVVIGGVVVGTIVADERVEIQSTSSVQGDIHTKSIVVLEGGMINGTVRMGEAAVKEAGQVMPRDAVRDGRDTATESQLRPGLALTQ
jgi:cytoskeletal protein CcmA (bactofilin family)